MKKRFFRKGLDVHFMKKWFNGHTQITKIINVLLRYQANCRTNHHPFNYRGIREVTQENEKRKTKTQ